MILVFGGTGTVGGEVLRALRAQGIPTRAVARDPRKAEALREVADEVVVADLADRASLEPALHGADAVFLVSPGGQGQVELEGHLVDALPSGGPHLVKLAAAGYDAVPLEQAIKLAANHGRVVAHIRARKVRHTVLAPSGFMTNLRVNAGTIREQGTIYGSSGDGGLGWIDPADIGAVAAHVLTSDGHDGASYTLTGPEVLNNDQVAERLTTVLGREVRYVDVPAEAFEQSLLQAGVPAWNAEALKELNQLYRAHHAEVVTDEVRKATGRDATSLSDWLQRNQAAFA